VEDVLAERTPRAEHRVIRPEEREAGLPLRVDRQELDTAHRRLPVAERGVERLVADCDGAELDDLDPPVVGEALATLRAFLLGGGREAVADDERVALPAAEVLVDVLDGGPDAARPARPDEDLASLRVDRTDHDRRQTRFRCARLPADVAEVVGDRAPRVAAAERERHRDGEHEPDDSGEDREPHQSGFLSRPHARSSLLPAFPAAG
jgi:hypothetical protein